MNLAELKEAYKARKLALDSAKERGGGEIQGTP